MTTPENRVYLSHNWGPSAPAYGGGEKIELRSAKSICCGDSSNVTWFSANSHIGTHFDFPFHFDEQGKKLRDYGPEAFFHNKVALAWCDEVLNNGALVTPELLKSSLRHSPADATLLLIRTGASTYRTQKDFWALGPGIDSGVAAMCRELFPRLTTVGVDCISITSFPNRELGRIVHREFLCQQNPTLLIEDLNLEPLRGKAPAEVVALPLQIESGDGAPATVVALL